MRQVSFRRRGKSEDIDDFIARALEQISQASDEDALTIADAFTVTGTYTPTRTLNAGTATTAQLAAFVATFISDLTKRGTNRSQ